MVSSTTDIRAPARAGSATPASSVSTASDVASRLKVRASEVRKSSAPATAKRPL